MSSYKHRAVAVYEWYNQKPESQGNKQAFGNKADILHF